MQTWATRHPELTAALELPRHHRNGPTQPDPTGAVWDDRINSLFAIRQLEDNWDGQGSPAPAVGVVDGALVFALLLRRDGAEPPTGVVQGIDGEVVFDWQTPDGKYVEVEVTGPYAADVYIHVPGQPVRHVRLSESGAGEAAA